MKKVMLSVMLSMLMVGTAMAGTATIQYTEPTVTVAGTPLTNLKETTVYWKQDAGVEQIIKVPASSVNGGAQISRVVTFVDPTVCTSTVISAVITAANILNVESARTASVQAIKAGDTTGCAIPNAPTNLRVTIP